MIEEERAIRLKERKEIRKEERRQKWLDEQEEERQRKRDEELKRYDEFQFHEKNIYPEKIPISPKKKSHENFCLGGHQLYIIQNIFFVIREREEKVRCVRFKNQMLFRIGL